ncbi:MAG: toprim domain-containing protein [bacterium]
MVEYTHKDIKTIDELIDHIRQNVGMYAGETETPLHLFEECFTNALDEAIADYCNIIAININSEENIYEVVDNGRGIPIENDTPISISTKFSGGKFKNSKTAYRITSGRHGVGLVVVNALSYFYQIEVYRDNKYGKFKFENGKLTENKIEKYNEKPPFSTRICFKPNEEYFNQKNIPFDKIRNRLLTASVELPKCTFVLNIDDKREVIKLDKYNFFKNNCLNNDGDYTDFLEIEAKDKNEKFDILLAYSKDGPVSQKIITSLNVLPVEGGGTHINIFSNILKDVISQKAKKLGYKIQPQDVLVRLRAYLSLYLENSEFGGQTKEKLTNRISYFDKISKKIKNSLETKLNNNEKLLIEILESLHFYRKNLDSKKFRNKTNGKKRGSFKFTKLKDCSSTRGELFVCEGDSAGGSIIDARNPEIHAILPLKGKIPSIVNRDVALKNTEIKELIQTLGTGIGDDFDISKLRYDKIVCATDADPDGSHIFVLLTMILYNLVPEIIRQGRFYLVRTPLRAINEKNTFIPLWSDEEYKDAVKNNRKITRFKGLGELNPWQIKICALDEETRRLIQVNFPENGKGLMELFEDVNKKRYLLNDDSVQLFNDI